MLTKTRQVIRRILGKRPIEPAELGALYDDGSWLRRPPTPDQMRIENHLKAQPERLAGKRLLHVGVGNSQLSRSLAGMCERIDGLTVMQEEADHAQSLQIVNYRAMIVDKYSDQLAELPGPYDVIIDNNLTSYAPNRHSYDTLMVNYVRLLSIEGRIYTDRLGMQYCRPYAFPIDDTDLKQLELQFPVRIVFHAGTLREIVRVEN